MRPLAPSPQLLCGAAIGPRVRNIPGGKSTIWGGKSKTQNRSARPLSLPSPQQPWADGADPGQVPPHRARTAAIAVKMTHFAQDSAVTNLPPRFGPCRSLLWNVLEAPGPRGTGTGTGRPWRFPCTAMPQEAHGAPSAQAAPQQTVTYCTFVLCGTKRCWQPVWGWQGLESRPQPAKLWTPV